MTQEKNLGAYNRGASDKPEFKGYPVIDAELDGATPEAEGKWLAFAAEMQVGKAAILQTVEEVNALIESIQETGFKAAVRSRYQNRIIQVFSEDTYTSQENDRVEYLVFKLDKE